MSGVLVLADVTYVEPWWMQILKSIVIFLVGLQILPMMIVAERKILGRLQNRFGPNRVGPFGMLQPMAEIVKFATKEQFRPRTSIGWLFALAPVISILTAVAALAIVPFGRTQDIFGTQTGLYGVDLSIGPLYLFAFGAVAFYGIMLGGWASGSKYSFLGSMRAAAQLISYEVSQGLALVGVIMTAQSLSLVEIVHAQGYMTEYGGTRMVAFLFAEYLNVLVVSLVITTVYLGGWLLPFGIDPPTWVDPFVVLFKMSLIIFFFFWIRATLPRLRYDQLMSLGWKVLLPLATLNTLVTAVDLLAGQRPGKESPPIPRTPAAH